MLIGVELLEGLILRKSVSGTRWSGRWAVSPSSSLVIRPLGVRSYPELLGSGRRS